MKIHLVLILLLHLTVLVYSQQPRARDIGIPFDGTTGKNNAITDVRGVEVGYSTIITGEGKNILGKGPVRRVLLPSCPGAETITPYLQTGTALMATVK